MPRKAPDLCVFCGESPCTCNTVAPKSPRPRSQTPKRAVPTQPVQSGGEDPFGDYAPPDKGSKFKSAAPSPQHRHRTAEEIEEHTAIRNLAPILSSQDRHRFASIIDPPIPAHLERELIDWRQRNARFLRPDGEA